MEVGPGMKPPVCKIVDYGKLKYEEKKKQDIDTLFGTSGKSLIIPLGAWDEGGVWGTVTGATTHFGIPNKVYNAIGLQEKETCQGGVLKMTVYNDSETDFLSLRLGKFMVRESEKTYIKEGDPETNFTTNDTLGTDLTRLVNVGLDKNTAKLYKNVKSKIDKTALKINPDSKIKHVLQVYQGDFDGDGKNNWIIEVRDGETFEEYLIFSLHGDLKILQDSKILQSFGLNSIHHFMVQKIGRAHV